MGQHGVHDQHGDDGGGSVHGHFPVGRNPVGCTAGASMGRRSTVQGTPVEFGGIARATIR